MSINEKMIRLMEYGQKNGKFLNSIPGLTVGMPDNEDMEEESFVERYGHIVDDAMVADELRWILDRGIEPYLLDKEAQIDSIEESLELARSEFKSRKANMDTREFDSWVRWNMHLKAEVNDIKLAVDQSLTPDEHSEEGKDMYNYLEMYIDRYKLSDLAMVMDILESMHLAKEISWYMYVQCGLAVCARLHYNSPEGGWGDTLENLRKHNQVNHRKVASYDDAFYGSMALNMEDAIDFMRKAREMAAKNDMSVQDMVFILMEERELQFGAPIEIGASTEDEYENLANDFLFDQQFEDCAD